LELVVVFVVTIVPADACFYLLWISTAKVAKLKLVKMGFAVPQKKYRKTVLSQTA